MILLLIELHYDSIVIKPYMDGSPNLQPCVMYFKVQTLIFNGSVLQMKLDMASHTFFEHLRIVNCIAMYKRTLLSFFGLNMWFLYLQHMFVATCMWHNSVPYLVVLFWFQQSSSYDMPFYRGIFFFKKCILLVSIYLSFLDTLI